MQISDPIYHLLDPGKQMTYLLYNWLILTLSVLSHLIKEDCYAGNNFPVWFITLLRTVYLSDIKYPKLLKSTTPLVEVAFQVATFGLHQQNQQSLQWRRQLFNCIIKFFLLIRTFVLFYIWFESKKQKRQ